MARGAREIEHCAALRFVGGGEDGRCELRLEFDDLFALVGVDVADALVDFGEARVERGQLVIAQLAQRRRGENGGSHLPARDSLH